MGSSKAYSASTASYGAVNTLTPGAASTWSPSDFDNLRLYLAGSSTGNNRYWRTYGADVTVEYSYTITYYSITASCNAFGSVSPASQEGEAGTNCVVTLSPNVAGLSPSKVLDNNVDVTSQIVASGNNFTYTLTGLAADHTIIVTFVNPVTYNISGTIASGLSVSPSLPTTAYEGNDFDLTITPTKPGTIIVRDNNVVTETFTIPVDDYTPVVYTIENVQAAHTLNITFTELAKYNITGSIGSGLTISPSLPVNNKYEGTDQAFTITPNDSGAITVTDNGVDTVYTIPRGNVHTVEYAISNITTNHTLSITFVPTQQFQITGTVQSGLSISPTLPQSVYTGDDISFTITPSAGGAIIVNDNGQDYIYTISRTDVQPVTHYIADVAEAHILAITYEPPEQFTVSGTVGSGVTCSPSLPQTLYTGDDLALTLTPSNPGVIRVVDNGTETGVFEIPLGQVAAVYYTIDGISESHTLAITYESLPQYTISLAATEPELTISPTLPQTKYLGESLTLTITPSTSGQITVLENNIEKAIYYIIPGDVHAVNYTLSNIAADHALAFKFSVLPQFTTTATLTGTGTLSDNSITDYAGKTITFTVSSVPSSNILLIVHNGENVSAKATKSGTTYTYSFELIHAGSITFTSKVPEPVAVNAYIDTFGTITPTTTTINEGEEYTLRITPTDYQTTATIPLSVSDNYVEVVDELVARKDTASSTYTATNSSYTSLNSSNNGLWANAVGKTAESPSTTSTSSNSYSSGNGTTGTITYTFNFSSIPNDAVITGISCRAYGHAESTTMNDSRFCKIQLYKNGTAVGEAGQYSSTSNSIVAIPDCGT